MNDLQFLISIAVLTIAIALTRLLPFIIFPPGKKTPEFIQYLGTVLPSAAVGMLLVDCYKDTEILNCTHVLPELIASLIIIVLHRWKRMMLRSVAGGTIAYMILIQFVFCK